MKRLALAALLLAGPAHAETVRASWYRDNPGGRTGCGERFNPHGLTAASYRFACGTRLLVKLGGRQVTVRVNDRGPARWTHRAIDLSYGAAVQLHIIHAGLARVQIRKISR